MKRTLLFLCALLTLTTVNAQQTDWRDVLRQWLNAEDMEESYGEETMELLEEKALAPINLNQTTREELEQLPFLSAEQVEELVAYLDRYHPMRSLGELMMIPSLDNRTRQLLCCFVVVGDEKPKKIWPSLADIAKYGKHTFMATAKIPFYERRGDQNGYLGYRYRHDIRYQFNYNNRIKFGLTGAQDAGEPFFSNKNTKGYDHYSYYFQLRNMGRLEELNIGMYRVQMGMGLVMNTGFYLGKLATLQSLGRSTHTLTAHSSRSVAGYLQGAAATVRFSPHWRVTAFASWRPIDGTLNDDGTVRTIITDGYHRTETEMSKKNNTHETDFGGSIGWRKGTLYVNANMVLTHLDRDLQPQTATLYRRYAAQGNNFFNASLDYGYNNTHWTLSGETALNKDGAWAAIHSASYRTSSALSLMLLHRYYDKRYTALHSRSFSENSSVQNEHGIYLGATWKPSYPWLIQGYVDYAHFSWARYQVSAPSDALDMLLAASYQKKQWTFNGRYRLHIRQRDNSEKTAVGNRPEHRMRLGADWNILPQLKLRTQADGVISQQEGTNSKGIMVSEHATWSWRFLKTDAHIGWFHTDDYNSRLYQYEASVRYDNGFPMYYGQGVHYALMLRGQLSSRLSATARIGVTKYFDRSVISSGLQQVNRSSMTDLWLQLYYQL